MLIRVDGIKLMSRGISGSKQVAKFAVNHNYNKFLKSDCHYGILAKTRSRMTTTITFSRKNDADSRSRTYFLSSKSCSF